MKFKNVAEESVEALSSAVMGEVVSSEVDAGFDDSLSTPSSEISPELPNLEWARNSACYGSSAAAASSSMRQSQSVGKTIFFRITKTSIRLQCF